MALRVLLADESATIKKVFQLALQDYGVEVMTVSVGLDVIDVAAKFKPDIVFADVLLQRKSGYEVCTEIKNHPELKNVPVVLVWSGFMELDQDKFKACGASGDLEKPFETFQLRDVVQSLVPKTQKNPLSQFLSFPRLPDFEEKPKPAAPTARPSAPTARPAMPKAPPPPPEVGGFEMSVVATMPPIPEEILTSPDAPQPETEPEYLHPISIPQKEATQNSWSMDNFTELPPIPEPDTHTAGTESPDEFMSVQLSAQPPKQAAKPNVPPPPLPDEELTTDAEDNSWVQKTLTNFKIDKKRRQDEDPSVSYQIPQEKIDVDSLITNTMSMRADSLVTQTTGKVPPRKLNLETEDELELDLSEDAKPQATISSPPQMSEKQLEAVIRAQSKEMIEKVVWQVVPEIATRIIEREIERLLKERIGQ